MTGFGAKLRAAREQKGISQSQLAASTRIMIQIIQGLEEENFSRIIAPIYGRGFAKLYAEQVGLDPQECAKEFMIAYSASKGEAVELPKGSSQPPSSEKASPPKADIFARNGSPENDDIARFFGESNKAKEGKPSQAPKQSMHLQLKSSKIKSIQVPARIWRMSALAILAIAFIWLVVASIRCLYKATSEASIPETQAAQSARLRNLQKTQGATTPRTPIKNTPELYFD